MVYIGTAGYSYKDWIGPFYPEGTKDKDMLTYYSSAFNFVEVNSTYYHMPSSRLFDGMNNKTPEEFKFAVKLFGGFTHEKTSDKEEAEKFKFALQPLVESNKMLCLLAQFPYSFHYNTENAEYLKRIKDWFPEFPVSIEFRNQQWISSEVFRLLSAEKLGFVSVDEPDIKGLIKKVMAVTSENAYLRMHGRNASKWYASEGSDRYNYLYSKQELEEWLPMINEMQVGTSNVVISFNNHPVGKAIQNAKMLSAMLGR